MTVLSVLDAAGRRRSPATLPGYHAGRPPRNKGMRYPADPPTVDEIVAAMRHASDDRHGCRVRAMIIVFWRAGLRIQEALAPPVRFQSGNPLDFVVKAGRRRAAAPAPKPLFAGLSWDARDPTFCLPCRRSRVRIPSAALRMCVPVTYALVGCSSEREGSFGVQSRLRWS
jgi:hypothetical protein